MDKNEIDQDHEVKAFNQQGREDKVLESPDPERGNTGEPKPGGEALQEDLLSQFKAELNKQREEVEKKHDLYLRALAETENIRKRAQREREEYIKYASVSIIKKLLPVMDDLTRAIIAAQQSQDFDALVKGVEMTAKSLEELLQGEGVKEIDCLGKPFDPEYHQPLVLEPSADYPENTVIEEFEKGYIIHGRVVRPSLVKVSQ